jgi:hypothetical protein
VKRFFASGVVVFIATGLSSIRQISVSFYGMPCGCGLEIVVSLSGKNRVSPISSDAKI